MREKYSGPEDKRDKWHQPAPNGAYCMANIDSAALQLESGAEHLSYFRSSVKNGATEWAREDVPNKTVTTYASCCGSLVTFNGPGLSQELNPDGIEGWERKEQPDGGQSFVSTTGCHKVTGFPAEDSKIPRDSTVVRLDDSCCGSVCYIFATMGFMTCPCSCNPCPGICPCCCGCCGRGLDEGSKYFGVPELGAKEFEGKAIDYIAEEKWLIGKNPPKTPVTWAAGQAPGTAQTGGAI